MQRGREQAVVEYEHKLEAQRAVARAVTTQVESLQCQVASLNTLQAENEALKSTVEASTSWEGAVGHESMHMCKQARGQ